MSLNSLGIFRMTSSLPIVSDTWSSLTGTYDTIKNKSESLKYFLSGVEAGVKSATDVAVPIALHIPGVTILDHLACQGLSKMESTIPLMKQTPEQILTESRQFAYSKISGESDPSKIPDSMVNALHQRAGSVASGISDIVGSSKIAGIAENVLTKTEEAIDSVLQQEMPKPVKVDNSIYARTRRVLAKFFSHFKSEASRAAKKQGKKRSEGMIEIIDLINLPRYWLTEKYESLRSREPPQSSVSRIFGALSMIAIGSTLAIWGAASATLQKGGKAAADSAKKASSMIPGKDLLMNSLKSGSIYCARTLVGLWNTTEKVVDNHAPDFVRAIFSRGKEYWDNISEKIVAEWRKETASLNLSSVGDEIRNEVNLIEEDVEHVTDEIRKEL